MLSRPRWPSRGELFGRILAIMPPRTTLATLVSAIPGANSAGRGATEAEATIARPRPSHRINGRTLVVLRGILILGQIQIVLVTWLVLKWPFNLGPCMALVGASVVMNVILALSPLARRPARPWEISAQLGFDIVQLATLLFLTGGVVNPFALLLIFPISVGGTALPYRHTIGLCVLGVIAAMVLTMEAAAPPWYHAVGPGTDYAVYRLSRSMALVIALAFATVYAIWSSSQGARRELALHLAETVLAREQRLSALGALSAAMAHEMGTPLATIAIVATEMVREAPEGPLRDDAVLMVEQARRCRDILRRMAEEPERQDALHERMSLLQFVREIVEPYAKSPNIRVEAVVSGPPGMAAPDLWRRPEIIHAISTMVENAFDFARGEILLTARFDAEYLSVEVRDDGPGFSSAILPKLGEPYVTSRPDGQGSRTGHIGMGLGLYIAKTLLERSGARLAFSNGSQHGAVINARWRRSRIEAPSADDR